MIIPMFILCSFNLFSGLKIQIRKLEIKTNIMAFMYDLELGV